jgi:cytoskeletal protein CcmA (bactofilin family)
MPNNESRPIDTVEAAAASVVEMPGGPTRTTNSPTLSQHSTIGKSIRIKGEISASDPVYVYGSVEGQISAPAHRVTVGKEGKVKANVNAREVVIMGEVRGNLNGGERVEIRSEGSVIGDLATHRICIEDGAVVTGSIDIRRPTKRAEAREESDLTLVEPNETGAEEDDANRENWDLAVSEIA